MSAVMSPTSWRRMGAVAAMGAGLAAASGTRAAGAQPLAERVARVANGTVRLSYATRPGVCGDGATTVGYGAGRRTVRFGSTSVSRDGEWEPDDCVPGPAHASLTVRDGAVTRVRVYVGGRWREGLGDGADLGVVPAPAAADYLLSVAERAEGPAGRGAVFAASLADSAVLWPRLLRLARSPVPHATRREAVFWVAEAAGDVADGARTAGTADAADLEVREHAVFALSQQPRDASVPALIRAARTNRDPQIRRRAIFWLGQSGDERALAFFEELLTGAR